MLGNQASGFEQIDELAIKISSLKLEALVVFLLEAHRPLVNVFHNAALGLFPLLNMLLGRKRSDLLHEILSDQSKYDYLMQAIEARR